MFCAKCDLGNYIYCDVRLEIKYKFGIVKDIFPRIPLIQDKE